MNAGTILIVEDNDDVRMSLADALSLEGYLIHEACNGAEALRLLATIPAPGLVILDNMMPVMDGPHFYRRFREVPEFAEVPVLIFSASVVRADFPGASGFLKKPADLEAILELIQKFSRGVVSLS